MSSPQSRSDPDSLFHERLSRSRTARPAEVVILYNYDHWDGHSLAVTVAKDAGKPILDERRYLPPGRSTSLSATIDPGEYQLHISVDGVERSRTVYHLDDTPAGTAVVELGNGVISVTRGTTITA